jgi:hypothetical protein
MRLGSIGNYQINGMRTCAQILVAVTSDQARGVITTPTYSATRNIYKRHGWSHNSPNLPPSHTMSASLDFEDLLAKANNSQYAVLQYNRSTDRLTIWKWWVISCTQSTPTPDSDQSGVRPSTIFARIHPTDFEEHRTSHQVVGPGCFCPKIDSNAPDFVESAMYIVDSGPFTGEYVAACAKDRCKYFGEPVKILSINSD